MSSSQHYDPRQCSSSGWENVRGTSQTTRPLGPSGQHWPPSMGNAEATPSLHSFDTPVAAPQATSLSPTIPPRGLPAMVANPIHPPYQASIMVCATCNRSFYSYEGLNTNVHHICPSCSSRPYSDQLAPAMTPRYPPQPQALLQPPHGLPAPMSLETLVPRPHSYPTYGICTTHQPGFPYSPPSVAGISDQHWRQDNTHPNRSQSYPTTPLPRASSELSISEGADWTTVNIDDAFVKDPVDGPSANHSVVKPSVTTHKGAAASILRRKTEPRYCCTVCGAWFTKKHNLESHVRSHYGQRPFTCKWCGKSFNRPNDCTRHEKGTCKSRPSESS